MHNSQHARVLARFLWPTLEHAQDVSAEFGSLDNCSCFEKVTYPAEALERDDHAVGMLWALLAGRDDEPNGHGQRAGALWDEYVLNLHRL